MVKKTKTTTPVEKVKKEKPFCKELGCFDEAGIKGFCRLHFIKNLHAKAQKPVAGESDDGSGPRTDRRRKSRNSKMIPVVRSMNETEPDPGSLPFDSDESSPSSLPEFDSTPHDDDSSADTADAEDSVRKAG